MTLIDKLRDLLVPPDPSACAHCGAPSDPLVSPSGSYRYCSRECVEADADDQADAF